MNRLTAEEKLRIKRKRKFIDGIYNTATFFSSFVGVLSLVAIFTFVFVKGSSLLSWELITGDYYAKEYHLEITPDLMCHCEPETTLEDSIYYSRLKVMKYSN